MEYTQNYALLQPEGTDECSNEPLNMNADEIDRVMHEMQEQLDLHGDELDNKLGRTETAAAAVLDGAGGNIAEQFAAANAQMSTIYGLGTAIPSGSNLDDYTTPGVYRASATSVATTLTNCPVSISFRMEVKCTATTERFMQIIYPNESSGKYYMRCYTASGWGSWYQIAGTAVDAINTATTQ